MATRLESRLSVVFRWAVRHWLGLLLLASGAFVTLPFAAPILASRGHETSSTVIYVAYRVTCHQLPHHSWFLGGRAHSYDWSVVAAAAGVDATVPEITLMHRPIGNAGLGYQVAFCQRDTAIHLAFLATALSFALVRRRPGPISWRLYLAALVPIGVDGVTQLVGLRDSTPVLRTASGALFGAATALLVLPHLDAGFRDLRHDAPRGNSAPNPGASLRLLLGTQNPAKQAELSAALMRLARRAGVSLEVVTPEDIGFRAEVPETAATFELNSAAKARTYHEASGLPVIADDGGLEITALGGAPGVQSRRWLESDGDSDEALIAYTLERLKTFTGASRAARLRTCLTYHDERRSHQECAALDGHIAETSSGRSIAGYPYRSLFVVDAFDKYYDELTRSEHEQVNHREKALARLFEAAVLPAALNSRT